MPRKEQAAHSFILHFLEAPITFLFWKAENGNPDDRNDANFFSRKTKKKEGGRKSVVGRGHEGKE